MTVLSLRAGSLAVDLAPQAGGSIARFSVERSGAWVDVMRPADLASLAAGRGAGASCYPLVPFSNRIPEGRLWVGGETFVLQPNWPGQRHPMHGDACSAQWRVEAAGAVAADLAYEHAGTGGWPFRYRARQSFRLLADRLTVEISVENTDRRAFPAGVGLHPFFSRDAETTVAFAAAHVWTADSEMIPERQVAVPREWDVRAPRRVDGIVVDNCFGGWDGVAKVVWPARGLGLTMTAGEPFRHVVFYAPKDRPYFCVEPVSHANNAFALHEEGVDGVGFVELAPGRTLGGRVEFRLSNL